MYYIAHKNITDVNQCTKKMIRFCHSCYALSTYRLGYVKKNNILLSLSLFMVQIRLVLLFVSNKEFFYKNTSYSLCMYVGYSTMLHLI